MLAVQRRVGVAPPADEADLFRRGHERRKLYRTLATLGEGSEGKVRLAEIISTGERCALKSLRKGNERDRGLGTQSRADRLRSLALKLGPLLHSNEHLPDYVDFWETKDTIYVAWELLKCPLSDYIARRGVGRRLDEPAAAAALQGILSALVTLHGAEIFHRDLKTANVLLRNAEDVRTVCVCDFGGTVAAVHSSDTYFSSSDSSDIVSPSSVGSDAPIHTFQGLTGPSRKLGVPLAAVHGSPAYMSPQATRGEPVSAKDDIWGVGIVAYELLYGRNPFDTVHSLAQLSHTIVSSRIEVPPGPSEGARAFVSWLLDLDADFRPTAARALADPWLQIAASQYTPNSPTPSTATLVESPDRKPEGFSFCIPQTSIAALSGAYVLYDATTGSLKLMGNQTAKEHDEVEMFGGMD